MSDWQDRLNSFSWTLRNRFPWAPPPLKRTVTAQWIDENLNQRGRELAQRYDLSRWPNVCSKTDFTESLYVLDLCDRYLEKKPTTRALDIGCKNWAYLPGLATWSGTPWDGVEIDGQRRYLNLATRRSYGEAMTQAFPDCRYIADSLTTIDQQYDLITWFLPFVRQVPHQTWGLPNQLFEPEQLLMHTWGLLKPGGQLLIVNQGHEEATIQTALLDQDHITYTTLGVLSSDCSPFQCTRLGFLITRPDTSDDLTPPDQ